MDQYGTTNSIHGGHYAGPVIQAASVTVQALEPVPPKEPWVRAVLESAVWAHSAPRDVEVYRSHAARLAGRLAAVRDTAGLRIAGDPWTDPGFAARFTDRVEWLLGEPDGRLDLYPSEAGVLVLLPYLYHVRQLRLVASRMEADPADLRFRPKASRWRAEYQSFLMGHDRLVNRAELRPESAPVIGWWLYRRWLQQEEAADQLTGLEAELAAERGPLSEALEPRRLARILTGLHLGADVCNAEHLGQMEADELLPGPGRQRIRERRTSLLLSVAYGAAIELSVLPDTVVEHTGIPNAVELDGVRRTLDSMTWGGPPELPVLKAVCEHEAVAEALREHAERLDGLLLAVGRTVPDRIAQPMPRLPGRISADGVVPAEGTFISGARFRLDDRRVRNILTGTQLYKDRGLAVRELYQNALDACRYRRARTQFLERSGRPFHPYEGGIDLDQGVDDEGRAYLECSDDGIGMGEAELRGVFSHAGARFAEQPDFLLEQAEWERVEPPVRLHPNSRFGIGVLSYFMLADEIRVTSCRMGLHGAPGPVVEAQILGPNHLFRIVEKEGQGRTPGTQVRLYLRERPRTWSAVDTLAKVLHIAEFRTTAQHSGRRKTWEAGVLPQSDTYSQEGRASGDLVVWEDSPPGAQVIWCEYGGMLLVDGILVQPQQQVGVMSGSRGVVVNLSGDYAPQQLSTDRFSLLTDVSGRVEELLTAAAPTLVTSGAKFLTLEWISEVAESSPRTADLVAEAAFEVKGEFRVRHSQRTVPAESGCFPLDRLILDNLLAPNGLRGYFEDSAFLSLADHLLLWRMLAHGNTDLSRQLTDLVPELAKAHQVIRARPSDLELLTGISKTVIQAGPSAVFDVARRLGCGPAGPVERRRRFGDNSLPLPAAPDSREWDGSDMTWLDRPYKRQRTSATIGDLLRIGEDLGVNATQAAARLRSYGLSVVPRDLPDSGPDETDLQLLHWNGEITEYRGIGDGGPVPPGHVAQAALRTGLHPHEVKRRIERYGVEVEPFDLPERPDQEYVAWLSQDHNGMWPWVSATRPLPPWQLLAVRGWLELSADDVRAEYERLGFSLPPRATCRELPDDFELLGGYDGSDWLPFWTDRTPDFIQLITVAEGLGLSLRSLINRLAKYHVRTAMVLPSRPTELDRELFRYEDLLRVSDDERDAPWWYRLGPDDEIPFFLLVLAARDLGRRPKELAARLGSYGLRVSRHDLPPGLSHSAALRLLTSDEYALPIPEDRPMPLAQLVRIARRADLPVADAARHLRDLGVQVGDLVETVRAALARVPSG
ncbi:wHTH domain-containing protein [Streptomyces lasiicapitis]|uniref:wHTH domain-containing protein n=1 Tax=Streptomyces lasiicapitis TaxID=1923961 RepID=UPI0036521E05